MFFFVFIHRTSHSFTVSVCFCISILVYSSYLCNIILSLILELLFTFNADISFYIFIFQASKMGLGPGHPGAGLPFFCHNGEHLTQPPPAHMGIPPYQLDPKGAGEYWRTPVPPFTHTEWKRLGPLLAATGQPIILMTSSILVVLVFAEVMLPYGLGFWVQNEIWALL